MARVLAVCLWALVFIVSVPAFQGVGAAAPGEVIITHGSMSTTAIPLWAAEDQGLFPKHGVKAKAVWVRGNPMQIATLASGDTQIAYGGATTALAAAVGGPKSTVQRICAGSALGSRASEEECGKPLRSGSSTLEWMSGGTIYK